VKYCIVNVDDFGASRGINRAVVAAHCAGVVTSASLMVDQRAAAEAAELAARHPRLSVGLHAQLTRDDGTPAFDFDNANAIAAELERQIEGFQKLLGRTPTHLDSHHNVHRQACLAPLFAAAARRRAIPLRDHSAVRWHGSFYAQWYGVTHPEQVTLASLRSMLEQFGDGVTELCTHIGYFDGVFESGYHVERELELATILDPRLPAVLSELDIRLIGYADVDHAGAIVTQGGRQ